MEYPATFQLVDPLLIHQLLITVDGIGDPAPGLDTNEIRIWRRPDSQVRETGEIHPQAPIRAAGTQRYTRRHQVLQHERILGKKFLPEGEDCSILQQRLRFALY